MELVPTIQYFKSINHNQMPTLSKSLEAYQNCRIFQFEEESINDICAWYPEDYPFVIPVVLGYIEKLTMLNKLSELLYAYFYI